MERQRAGREEEDEDPDGPVREAVVELVSLAKTANGSGSFYQAAVNCD